MEIAVGYEVYDKVLMAGKDIDNRVKTFTPRSPLKLNETFTIEIVNVFKTFKVCLEKDRQSGRK